MLRRCFAVVVMVLASLSTTSTWAHPGGVDDRGGHTNRKTGEYHCHREGCDARTQVERATREAEREGRAFVERYDRRLYKHWYRTRRCDHLHKSLEITSCRNVPK